MTSAFDEIKRAHAHGRAGGIEQAARRAAAEGRSYRNAAATYEPLSALAAFERITNQADVLLARAAFDKHIEYVTQRERAYACERLAQLLEQAAQESMRTARSEEP